MAAPDTGMVKGGFPMDEHAVYPGTFDPFTPGHLDIVERARRLFARVTVLVAVNSAKQPAGTQPERAVQVRRAVPDGWDDVAVAAWDGLTAEFCRQHGASVIIRGVRNRSDLRHEYQLAAMNETLGITTLLLPARPELAAMSSTAMRGLGRWDEPGLPSRWAGVEAKLPPALDELAGPADGVVELPLDLAWSGDRRFDLADPLQRYLYHVTVLTSAVTPEHYTSWLNASLLRGEWGKLRLPRPLRDIWQAHFPELEPG